MKELQNIFINPGNSILVIVDMENEFCVFCLAQLLLRSPPSQQLIQHRYPGDDLSATKGQQKVPKGMVFYVDRRKN